MEKILWKIRDVIMDKRRLAPAGEPLGKILTVYLWNPVLIPASNMPALGIYLESEETASRWTELDETIATIKIKYIQDVKDFLGGLDERHTLKMEIDAMRLFSWISEFEKLSDFSIIGMLQRSDELREVCQWYGGYSVNYAYEEAPAGGVFYGSTLTFRVRRVYNRF